jgi:phosphatidylserine/phosphatidylglycerophosphate/cardiolipin synthase-like enzyme
MRRSLVLTAALLLSLAPGGARGPLDREPTMAATRLYYGPSEGFDQIDPGLIARARQNIDMAAYVLTQRPVIDALEAAVRRGVKLRLYLDPDQRDP